MAKQLLVIEGNDQGKFFLSVDGGALAIGAGPEDVELVLRDLYITRIHCEVEVGEGPVVVSPEGSAPGLRKELQRGEAIQVDHAHLRLELAEAAPAAETVAEAEADDLPRLLEEAPSPDPGPQADGASPSVETGPAPVRQEGVAKRLFVVNGADQGRSFPLPESGTVSIGRHKKHADIALNDFYVSRVHCELFIEGASVVVTHVSGQNGTLINGQAITKQELLLGDVLRVGNSHLKLETALAGVRPGGQGADDAETGPAASEGEAEVAADEDAFEIVEEEEQSAEPEEAPEEDESFSLPHAPVVQLLQLEDQVLGHFQIGPLLGRGQSSLVFRAQDLKHKTTVALKVISPDFPATDQELQRFAKALKAVPLLQHAHLVVLYGAGKTGSCCWIAREHVEGESVTRLISRLKDGGKFDWTRSCRVALHLGRVLDFLHQNKVTHGNITPRNILVRQSDKVTKLTDLMLNQALEGSCLQKAILGKKLLLELPYMAPEQTDPHAPGTPTADLYSLGSVCYALLTGQPAFTGHSSKEVLSQIRAGKVAKPSKLQAGIPAPFEAAVLKLMAVRPADRYQTAAEMLAVVEPLAREHHIS